MYSLLNSPIKVGNQTLKNRIIFPPTTTSYEGRDGSISSRALAFYERLAKGGTSYIVLGDVAPCKTISPTPKLYSKEQVPQFKLLADTLHKYGAKLSLQVFHPEYDVKAIGAMFDEANALRREAAAAKEAGNDALAQEKQAAADAVMKQAGAKLHSDMQNFTNTITVEQLQEIKAAMVECVKLAKEAGVDAIQIHGDRIVGTLCSTILNHREDQYGGSFENRTRFALEITHALREAAGPDMILDYKLPLVTINPDGSLRGKGGLLEDEAIELAKLLEKAGVDMLHPAQANHTSNSGDTIPAMGAVPYGWTIPSTEKIKKAVSIPVTGVGRIFGLQAGEDLLAAGNCDLVGYSRSLLCDPDLGNKALSGEPVRQCLSCNRGCLESLSNRRYVSCILNAENGDEETIFIKPSEEKKKIAVVGGGIAGLEAARVAAKRGFEVTVFEKTGCLGGQLNLACVPPRKDELKRAMMYYEAIIPALAVQVKLNTAPGAEELNDFDHVIVAVGAHAKPVALPDQKAAFGENVVSAWDILSGKKKAQGSCLVLGGGLVGTETAEFLAEQGHSVTVAKAHDKIAEGIVASEVGLVEASYKKYGVQVVKNVRARAIDGNLVTLRNHDTDEESVLCADTIVVALGSVKNIFDETGITVPITYAGDCCGEKTADIAHAVRSGYMAANNI